MQVHLDGFKPGNPHVADASDLAAPHTDAAPAQVDVQIVGGGPAHADPRPWVAQGRALFAAGRHDLGQMRLQINARSWRPEPGYRDAVRADGGRRVQVGRGDVRAVEAHALPVLVVGDEQHDVGTRGRLGGGG